MTVSNIIVYIILLWVFIYTVSFGLWTWKDKNILGAIMIFILAISVLVLPIYTLIFRA